jgi:hypothetical protein
MGWLVVYVQSNRIVVQGMVALPHKHTHTMHTHLHTQADAPDPPVRENERGIDDGLVV